MARGGRPQHHRPLSLLLLLLAALLIVAPGWRPARAAALDLDGFEDEEGEPLVADLGASGAGAGAWDESEFEGAELLHQREQAAKQAAAAADAAASAAPPPPAGPPPPPRSLLPELAAILFLGWYCVNVWLGKARNEAIALAWGRTYLAEGAVLERNFALLGAGDEDGDSGEVLMKETASQFKFWASGRRLCWGLLAELDLRRRQDLLSLALYLVQPKPDVLNIEVYMNEATMPAVVLAVATPRCAKALAKERRDLQLFTHAVTPARDRLPAWPERGLAVLAEHSTLFYELVADPLMDLVFGKAAWEAVGPYFRYLIITSEAEGANKHLLRFSFELPPPARMDDIARLMAAVPALIDAVGSYRLTPDQKKKADAARAAQAATAFAEEEAKRREAAQQRKADARQAELAKIRKLPPDQREKYEERQRRIEMRRQMRSRTKMLSG